MARGRPSRKSVYARLDRQIDDLWNRPGGLPSPVEAADIWKGIWYEEEHHSTALEGNTLVLKQVEALLAEGRAAGDPPSPNPVMAMLMAMSLAEKLSLAEVKNRLSEVVAQVERDHGRVVITKRGRPAAVVLSIEDLESLEETLDILASQPLLAQIRKSTAELMADKAKVLAKDEALALVQKS